MPGTKQALNEDLGMNITGFTLAGENEDGTPIEVEFFQPLDEDVDYEGVACGFRLIMVQKALYSLQKYRKIHKHEDSESVEEEEGDE